MYGNGLVFGWAKMSVCYPLWIIKMKRGTHQPWWGKWEGNHFANNGSSLSLPLNMALVCKSFQSIGYSADLRDDPLSWVMSLLWVFQKNALSTIALCVCPIQSCYQVFCHATRCSKGIWKSFTSTVCIVFVSVSLSQSYGYYIHIILELCSKFLVINVGLIMALFRWDFSRRHQLIIREIVLETIIGTLRSVCLNDRFSSSRHRFT